jgi:hypothetical protein
LCNLGASLRSLSLFFPFGSAGPEAAAQTYHLARFAYQADKHHFDITAWTRDGLWTGDGHGCVVLVHDHVATATTIRWWLLVSRIRISNT